MMARCHTPIRTCIGCGSRDRRGELIRLVLQPDGGLRRDELGAPGRGGYLHRREDCWTKFARRGGTVRSFRSAVQVQARKALLVELRAGADL